jgi:hypothetical protein
VAAVDGARRREAGMWLSEKARRSCREEGDDEEERKGWCRNGVDELRSNILLSEKEAFKEEAEMPLRPRDLTSRAWIYIIAIHRMEPATWLLLLYLSVGRVFL